MTEIQKQIVINRLGRMRIPDDLRSAVVRESFGDEVWLVTQTGQPQPQKSR